ncbi:MAG TPA: hypothetical protein VLS90_11270 [Thermodesulfobacteriota bacterium]|nr:hypothetical protein [Thermodesulfobacteriota bacterium]
MKIYVRLLDEGTEVSRPTECVDLGNGRYRLLATSDYDSEHERWEFPPNSVVHAERRRGSVGDYFLAVRSEAV